MGPQAGSGGTVTVEHREHVTDWWCEVMGGPDEYTTVVNDNLYTNVMARFNLERAAAAAKDLDQEFNKKGNFGDNLFPDKDVKPGDSWVVPRGAEHSYRILEAFSAVEILSQKDARAYAEFISLDTMWPDFDRRHLWYACELYAQRDRRFGGALPNPVAPPVG